MGNEGTMNQIMSILNQNQSSKLGSAPNTAGQGFNTAQTNNAPDYNNQPYGGPNSGFGGPGGSTGGSTWTPPTPPTQTPGSSYSPTAPLSSSGGPGGGGDRSGIVNVGSGGGAPQSGGGGPYPNPNPGAPQGVQPGGTVGSSSSTTVGVGEHGKGDEGWGVDEYGYSKKPTGTPYGSSGEWHAAVQSGKDPYASGGKVGGGWGASPSEMHKIIMGQQHVMAMDPNQDYHSPDAVWHPGWGIWVGGTTIPKEVIQQQQAAMRAAGYKEGDYYQGPKAPRDMGTWNEQYGVTTYGSQDPRDFLDPVTGKPLKAGEGVNAPGYKGGGAKPLGQG